MTKNITLKAEKREGKVDNGFIAGILYGSDTENINIKVSRLEFEKLYKKAGEATLVDFTLDKLEPVKVLIKDIQREPVKDIIIHLDLYKVNMKKEITADIPLVFVGESKAVKEMGAILNKNLDNVEVICLPSDLVDHIDVDLSAIDTLEDVIRIKDIKSLEGIKLQDEVATIVASVSEQREEEEEVVEEEEEVKEGEATKEGETPKEGEAVKEGGAVKEDNKEETKK